MVQGSNPPLCSLQNVAPSNIVIGMENGRGGSDQLSEEGRTADKP